MFRCRLQSDFFKPKKRRDAHGFFRLDNLITGALACDESGHAQKTRTLKTEWCGTQCWPHGHRKAGSRFLGQRAPRNDELAGGIFCLPLSGTRAYTIRPMRLFARFV
jgi:hypothetical protein